MVTWGRNRPARRRFGTPQSSKTADGERSEHRRVYDLPPTVLPPRGPPSVYKYGVENSPPLYEPAPIADSLRNAIRLHQTGSRIARTVGIIFDSIAGPFDKAVDGVHGPAFLRLAITEMLDSIRVGVGVGDEKTWSPVDDSEALRIGRTLPSGGVIERENARFVLPHGRRESDDKSWLVATFHITVGNPEEPGHSHDATTYAHSQPGVLAAEK